MAVAITPSGPMTTADNPFSSKSGDAASNQPTKSKAQLDCEAKGGKWDKTTNSCIMPKESTNSEKFKIGSDTPNPDGTYGRNVTAEEYAEIKKNRGFAPDTPGDLAAFNSSETGQLSGFEAGGNTILGANPQDTRTALEGAANKQQLEIGGQAEGVIEQRRQQLQNKGFDLVSQVGADPLNDLQAEFSAQQVNYLSAVKSAVPGIISEGLEGAKSVAGLLAGAALIGGQLGPQAATPEEVVTIPVAAASGAVIGAILGGIKGFYTDFVSDVKSQKGAIIETPIRTLTETKPELNNIISSQNANPENAVENLEVFNQQLQLVDDEYNRLKDLTDDDLNAYLGENGINQLQEYEVYYTPGGERDGQIREMQLALANPDPSRIKANTITQEEINKRIEEELKKLR